MIEDYVYRSEFARKYIAEGREAGRNEGRNEGLKDASLRLARLKLSAFTSDVETRIRSIDDPRVLGELIDGLAGAKNEREADAVLARHA